MTLATSTPSLVAAPPRPPMMLLGDPDVLPQALIKTLGKHYKTAPLPLADWGSFWKGLEPPCIALFGLSPQSVDQLPDLMAEVARTPQVAVLACVSNPEDTTLWRALSTAGLANAFAAGAPLAQVEHCIAGAELTRWMREQGRLREARLEHLHQTLRSFHMVDMDTGLYNRRYLLANLAERMALASRYKRSLSLVACVVQNHEELEDKLSEDQLAEVYEGLADTLQFSQRNSDLVARAAEDVFVIVLPDTDEEGAGVVAGRLLTAINSGDRSPRMDVVIGISCSEESTTEPLVLLDRAEAQARDDEPLHDEGPLTRDGPLTLM